VVAESFMVALRFESSLTAMSKRYSESSNQDLKNDSAECLRREWDIVGTKESDTPPPSSVDFF
jgi:hypothetical protein